jgi:hypothetical protein
MAPLLQYCLPALGVCRHFPRRLAFSTLDYMGLDIKRLFILQEIFRIKDIIFHTFNDTLTGKLYRTSLELFFLELGIQPWHFHAEENAIVALTSPSLVQTSMLFMSQFKIYLKHSIRIPLLREGDQFIIEAFLSLDIPIQDLVACNKCRLFLKVCLLSDIATGDGDFTSEEAWSGTYVPQEQKDKPWPSYPKQPPSSWRTWRFWLTKAFLSRGIRLRYPLGQWLLWDKDWKWYCTEEGGLYSIIKGQWRSHPPIIRRNRLPKFAQDGEVSSAPPNPRKATVYKKGTSLICTGSDRIWHTVSSRASTFLEHLQGVHHLGWCTHSLVLKNDGRDLAEALHFGLSATIMAVSDGSYKDLCGTVAWTIGTDDTEHIISGRAICPGGPEAQSAYRSELTGLYSILAILHQVCLYFDVPEGNVQIGCDGLSVLQNSFEKGPLPVHRLLRL